MNENAKLIKQDNTLDKQNKYLGIYTFLIREAFHTMEFIPWVVASVLKLKIICPIKTYTGKFSISILNILEKTTDNTIIINSGFKTVHSIPKKECLYRTLISLFTSSRKRGWYLKKPYSLK